jgi:hypothetical protein
MLVLACHIPIVETCAGDEQLAVFDEQIAPILSRRCVGCHNGFDRKGGLNLVDQQAALGGGDSGSVITAQDADSSLLWQRVRDGEMPPRGPLPDAEKERLRTWIQDGARWGTNPIDIHRFTTETRAGRDWWSLQPLCKPDVRDSAVHPVDYFLRMTLEQHSLTPSGPADRRTLIRRLSFNLLGLPPSFDEVERFVNDPDPSAYDRLVTDMLNSPHFGERWARHWLDVARYGESDGFEYDRMRPDAWHYRDWVVEALNADVPYDEFAKRQIAGDVLYPGDPAAITATGFLVCGASDGLLPQGEVMRKIMRQDALEDFVGTVCQTFLGLTTNCARCHDHKFDPISQMDYYRIAASLAGVTHGTRTVPAVADRVASLQQEVAEVNADLAEIERPIREQILAELSRGAASGTELPAAIAEWDFTAAAADRLSGQFHGNARRNHDSLELDGVDSYFASLPIATAVREKTLEVRVQLDSLDQKGGAAITLQTLDGAQFDGIVFAEREPRMWMAGSNSFVRTRSFQGPEEQIDTEFIHWAIVYEADGTITGYRNGLPYGLPYKSEGVVEYPANNCQILFGLRHAPPDASRLLRGKIALGRLYDRALTPEQIAASAGHASNIVSRSAIVARLSGDVRSTWESLRRRQDRLVTRLRQCDRHETYAAVPQTPGATHLLRRGNPMDEGSVVAPGGLSGIAGVNADFGLDATAPEGDRRRKLAEWVASEHNPLFARVIVNRLWHHHFGRGLVGTPNDLGFNGGLPSHPELLDWLAATLIENRWSLKSIHRLIVTSHAYRQLSVDRNEAMTVDADNRWLWKFPSRRLDAEEIRDATLSVAGQLQSDVGGPAFRDVRPYFHRGSQFYEPIDPAGPEFHRRSIYRMWARGGRSPMLDVFDCPDPSATAPARGRTTTPLQALTMMNHSFSLRMSEALAQRIEQESQAMRTESIVMAFRRVLCRDPRYDEQRELADFVAQHGLAAVCRVLLNANEFLHVE